MNVPAPGAHLGPMAGVEEQQGGTDDRGGWNEWSRASFDLMIHNSVPLTSGGGGHVAGRHDAGYAFVGVNRTLCSGRWEAVSALLCVQLWK